VPLNVLLKRIDERKVGDAGLRLHNAHQFPESPVRRELAIDASRNLTYKSIDQSIPTNDFIFTANPIIVFGT